jgi:uncharacterized protein
MTDAKDESAGFEAYRQGNYNRALELWKPLGELGNPEAQFWIGHLHYYGQGVTQDYSEAEKWYRLAAERGLTAAQMSLGNLFERGLGVSKDYVEAGEWYRRVAEQDEAAGQWALGNLYNDGLGVSQNFAEAAKWYRLAADQGFAPRSVALESYTRQGGVFQGIAPQPSSCTRPLPTRTSFKRRSIFLSCMPMVAVSCGTMCLPTSG